MFVPHGGDFFDPWQPEDSEQRRKSELADKQLRHRLATGPRKPWHAVVGLPQLRPLSPTCRLLLLIAQIALSLLLVAAGAALFWLENTGQIRGRGTTDMFGGILIIAGAALFFVPSPGGGRRSG
jgi:hypothetical protein